jgi:hypothetical protein
MGTNPDGEITIGEEEIRMKVFETGKSYDDLTPEDLEKIYQDMIPYGVGEPNDGSGMSAAQFVEYAKDLAENYKPTGIIIPKVKK